MDIDPRHLSVLRLYALGLTRVEIGQELFLAPATIKTYLAQACDRLDARNSTHAVTICVARGLLCVDGRAPQVDVYIPRPLDAPTELLAG